MTVVLKATANDHDADVLGSHLLFHLNARVDTVVVAVDARLAMSAREILETHERNGSVRVIDRPPSPRSE